MADVGRNATVRVDDATGAKRAETISGTVPRMGVRRFRWRVRSSVAKIVPRVSIGNKALPSAAGT